MAKPKLRRQGLLGQFLLGTDPFGAPVQTNVPLSDSYTRTNQSSGLVIGGRSAREFYHPTPNRGVILSQPHLTVFRWDEFSAFTGNANSSLVNGLTVDGLIDPASPSGGGLMMFPNFPLSWSQLGLPIATRPTFLTIDLECQLTVELPQFIGFRAGESHEGGFIDDLYTNIVESHGNNLVDSGSVGMNTPFWPYRTGLQTNTTRYDFSFVPPDIIFGFEIWISWNRPNGRFNLKSATFTMKW